MRYQNKASIDILLLLNLRGTLNSGDKIALKERLAVSATYAEKHKRIQKSWDYLTRLSQATINPTALPAPLPPNNPLVEYLIKVKFGQLRLAALLLVVGISLSLTYLGLEEVQEEPGALVTLNYAKNLSTQENAGDLDRQIATEVKGQAKAFDVTQLVDLTDKEDNTFRPGVRRQVSRELIVAPSAGPISLKEDVNSVAFLAKKQRSEPPLRVDEKPLRGSVKVAQNRSPNTESQAVAMPSRPREGFVIRAFLDLSNIAKDEQKVSHFLNDFDLIKAGQVELGWSKEPNLLYYHFLIGENFEKPIKEGLSKMGSLSWEKVSHPRRLKPGQARIILEVRVKDLP